MSHLKLCDRCVSLLALRGCVLFNVSPQTVWPLRISPCAQGLCIIECLTSNCVTAAYLSLRSGVVYYWMSHLKLCDHCVSLLALRGCVLLNVSPQTVWPLRISPCPQGLCIIECLTSNCVTAAYLSLPSGVVYYWMSHPKLCDRCVSLLALRGCVLLNVSPQTVWPLRISPCPQGLCIIECLTSNCVTAAYLSLPSGVVYYWMSHLKLCDCCVSLLALRACVLLNASPQTVWPLRISPCPQGLCIIECLTPNCVTAAYLSLPSGLAPVLRAAPVLSAVYSGVYFSWTLFFIQGAYISRPPIYPSRVEQLCFLSCRVIVCCEP